MTLRLLSFIAAGVWPELFELPQLPNSAVAMDGAGSVGSGVLGLFSRQPFLANIALLVILLGYLLYRFARPRQCKQPLTYNPSRSIRVRAWVIQKEL